jgi:MarR family transcriptional regulator, negative regulator of the multidrug operon emrRAB
MTTMASQIQEVEASLNRLKLRVPDLPVTQILTSRALVSLGRELSNMLDQRLRPHGLSEIEFRTLIVVYSLQDTAAYPGELGTSLGQSPANITRITDNLVERGLVSRVADERDRRRLMLTITPAGEQLVQNLLPVMNCSVHESFQDFSPADLNRLLDGLRHLARVIDEACARKSPNAKTEAAP